MPVNGGGFNYALETAQDGQSLLIFQRQGIKAIAAPTDFHITQQDMTASQSNWQAVILNCLPDTYQLYQSTTALKEHIGLIVYRLLGWL